MIGPAAGSAPSITGNGTHEPGRGRFHRVVSAPPGAAVDWLRRAMATQGAERAPF